MSITQPSAPWVGQSIPRKEDLRLFLGHGKYLADIVLPRMLHLVFARSAQAHARLRAVDVARARTMRGVVAVVAINIAEGFNLGFAKARPGNGPLMHTHNTNETFMPISGTWRCEFNEGDAHDYVDLGPLDVVSFPPGMARRFMNVTKDEPDIEHILLFVIAGNAPEAESTDAAKKFMEDRIGNSGAHPATR